VSEAEATLARFLDLLRDPTEDGQRKRRAGAKPHWAVEDARAHAAALDRHLTRWRLGEQADADSGAHPLAHVAWRALAIAAIETDAADHRRRMTGA
jgi:hypothetical protein